MAPSASNNFRDVIRLQVQRTITVGGRITVKQVLHWFGLHDFTTLKKRNIVLFCRIQTSRIRDQYSDTPHYRECTLVGYS